MTARPKRKAIKNYWHVLTGRPKKAAKDPLDRNFPCGNGQRLKLGVSRMKFDIGAASEEAL